MKRIKMKKKSLIKFIMIEECPVCFEELEDNIIVMNACHKICFACLTKILTTDRRCCICRQDYQFPIKSFDNNYEETEILSLVENVNLETEIIVKRLPEERKEYSKNIYIIKLKSNGLSISDFQLSYITPSTFKYSLFLDIHQHRYDLISEMDVNDVTVKNAKIYYILKKRENLGESLMILCKTLTGKSIVLYVKSNDIVADIKDIIFEKEGIPKELQRLTFRRLRLENRKSLSDYDIQEGSTLHLSLLIRGD